MAYILKAVNAILKAYKQFSPILIFAELLFFSPILQFSALKIIFKTFRRDKTGPSEPEDQRVHKRRIISDWTYKTLNCGHQKNTLRITRLIKKMK